MVAPNKALISEKQDSLIRCLKRVQTKTPLTLSDLEKDIDAQDIISLNIERAVQVCVDIANHLIAYTELPAPITMAQSFKTLEKAGILKTSTATRLQKAVGLRNILVHQYKVIEWKILWQVITTHLEDFDHFLKEIDSYLKRLP